MKTNPKNEENPKNGDKPKNECDHQKKDGPINYYNPKN